jgi:hypothetical protein
MAAVLWIHIRIRIPIGSRFNGVTGSGFAIRIQVTKICVGRTVYCIFIYFFLCRAAWELSDDSFFVPEALVFGSDDFAADIGIK